MKHWWDLAATAAQRTGDRRAKQAVDFLKIAIPALRSMYKAGLLDNVPGVGRKRVTRRGSRRLRKQYTNLRRRTQKKQTGLEYLQALPATVLTLLTLPLGRRAEYKYKEMGEIETAPAGDDFDIASPPASPAAQPVSPFQGLPPLSIIIPARNEAENLEHLLPSLDVFEYPGELEIIVVDDHSDDGTGAVAENFGARVIRVEDLPEGWHGKPHACHLGALAAKGEWLLFTDADTLHTPDSATRTVFFAQEHGLDGLTLFLKQTPRSLLQGSVLTAAFAGLFAGTSDVNRLMNGQYILLKRSVYVASGGLEAVRGEALEDLAFGNRLQKLGYKVLALRGETAASVQAYANPEQMWHGMTRLGAGSLKWSGTGGLLTALFTTALASPVMVLWAVLTRKVHFGWLLLAWSIATASVIPFARRFGNVRFALLAPFGALFVLCAAIWGLVSRIQDKGIPWKGRKV